MTTLLSKRYHCVITIALSCWCTIVLGRVSTIHSRPPVFWNIFNASVEKNKVLLEWEVTEYNNKIFYIQQSLDGIIWRTIDSIRTKNSSLTLDDYSYAYISRHDGRQYFRVRQVDLDMKTDGYSPIESVVVRVEKENRSGSPSVSLTPNPATDQIRIVNEIGTHSTFTNASIFDLTGKLVAEKQVEPHSNSIVIRDLPPGIYIMRARSENGNSYTQKIIKQ